MASQTLSIVVVSDSFFSKKGLLVVDRYYEAMCPAETLGRLAYLTVLQSAPLFVNLFLYVPSMPLNSKGKHFMLKILWTACFAQVGKAFITCPRQYSYK